MDALLDQVRAKIIEHSRKDADAPPTIDSETALSIAVQGMRAAFGLASQSLAARMRIEVAAAVASGLAGGSAKVTEEGAALLAKGALRIADAIIQEALRAEG